MRCIEASFAVVGDALGYDAGVVAASTEILRGGTRASISGAMAHGTPNTLMKVMAGETSVTFCSCLKCGSTSFFAALYKALHSQEFVMRNYPPYVQDWGAWDTPLVTRSSVPGDLNIVIYRDPIERYVSSWRHRGACCNEYTEKMCIDQDEKLFFIQMLLRGNKIDDVQGKTCLSFPEFVTQLEIVAQRGTEGVQNMHWIPQDVTCPSVPDTIFVTIEEISEVLAELTSAGKIHGDELSM